MLKNYTFLRINTIISNFILDGEKRKYVGNISDMTHKLISHDSEKILFDNLTDRVYQRLLLRIFFNNYEENDCSIQLTQLN